MLNLHIERKNLLKWVLVIIPLVAQLVLALALSIKIFFISELDYIEILQYGVGLTTALVLYLIGKHYDDSVVHNEHQEALNTIKGMKATAQAITTAADFYKKLNESRSKAQKKVRLTNLDPWAPFESNSNTANAADAYFREDIPYIKNNQSIEFYRIISIETEEKLKWTRTLIEEVKDFKNVFLAYIDIDDIVGSFPFPKILSLQIIDNKEVFMLHPAFSYMPRAYQRCYYLKGKKIAQEYSEYYDYIWDVLDDTSEHNGKHGCILKNGPDMKDYEEKLKEIETKIKDKNGS